MYAVLIRIVPDHLPLCSVLLRESVGPVTVSVSQTTSTKPYSVVNSQTGIRVSHETDSLKEFKAVKCARIM